MQCLHAKRQSVVLYSMSSVVMLSPSVSTVSHTTTAHIMDDRHSLAAAAEYHERSIPTFATMSQPSPSSRSSASGDKSRDPSPFSEQTSKRSKAGIRVSLACLPCRSKHIKCDATVPACQRCLSERKQCYYAKSRRGIRDPKKRHMLTERPSSLDPPTELWAIPPVPDFQMPFQLPDNTHGGWGFLDGSTRDMSVTTTLIDSYYVNFYPSHPWTLPKHYMIAHMSTAPRDVEFLVNVFCLIGSVFESNVPSQAMRDAAFDQACGMLPPTVFTVQGLMMLAVVGLGEGNPDLVHVLLNRAVDIALDLGMHLRSFAEAEADPVIAENYRRTFWSLYLQDCISSTSAADLTSRMGSVAPTTDIPCEDWEYRSGLIPRPVPLYAYDNRDPVDEREFTSWAYMIELCRIIGEANMLIMKMADGPTTPEQSNGVDMRILNWLLRVPRWKHDIAGPDGHPDWVIYMALELAHTTRLRLRWPRERARLGLRSFGIAPPAARLEAPPPPPSGGPRLLPWGFYPPELQATDALCDLVGRGSAAAATTPWGPLALHGLGRAAAALLDACARLGRDTPATRERLSLVFAVLRRHAGAWPLAGAVASDIKEAVRACLPAAPRDADAAVGGGGGSRAWQVPVPGPSGQIPASAASASAGPTEESFFAQFSAAALPLGFEDWVGRN